MVDFPSTTCARFGEKSTLLHPLGGDTEHAIWDEKLDLKSYYPQADGTMQFMAIYGHETTPTALYLGMHDPKGSMKHINVISEPKGGVRLSFDHYAPPAAAGRNASARASANVSVCEGLPSGGWSISGVAASRANSVRLYYGVLLRQSGRNQSVAPANGAGFKRGPGKVRIRSRMIPWREQPVG